MKKLITTIFLFLFLPSFVFAALVNINTAGPEELDTLTGVGPVIAGKIIDYRNVNGAFKTIEEIKNVSGIGDATFLKMKDQITVGIVSPIITPSNGNLSDGDTVSGSEEGGLSAHTNSVGTSDYQEEALEISAGRDRLATVRTPMLFSASQNKRGKINYFNWSFGDGTSALGTDVYHSYQFPGTYNVILNGKIDNKESAVSRIKVVVAETKIKITDIDMTLGYVEISNSGDKEQNLNSWILSSDGKKYAFPVDTVISSKSSIKIPLAAIGFNNGNVKEITLSYPDGGVASGASLQEGVDRQKIAELKKQLVKVRRQIENNSVESSLSSSPVVAVPSVRSVSKEGDSVVILKKEPSWFERVKNALFK